MRFENAEGKSVEVASNHVGPERVPVPPGYRFVSSVPMVPASQLEGAVEALKQIVLHANMPAGESWERAYVEVTSMARDALDLLGGQ